MEQSHLLLFSLQRHTKEKKALFNKPKRFPGKDKNDDYFPPIKVLRVPLYVFEEKKEIDEIVSFEDEEDII